MPYVFDASDYIRRRRIQSVVNANNVTNQSKFRALTVHDGYDASVLRAKGGIFTDALNSTNKHDLTNLMSLSYRPTERIGVSVIETNRP